MPPRRLPAAKKLSERRTQLRGRTQQCGECTPLGQALNFYFLIFFCLRNDYIRLFILFCNFRTVKVGSMTEKPEFSIVWSFFNKNNDSSSCKCKKCGKELKYTGSTSGMISHLRSTHKQEMLEKEEEV